MRALQRFSPRRARLTDEKEVSTDPRRPKKIHEYTQEDIDRIRNSKRLPGRPRGGHNQMLDGVPLLKQLTPKERLFVEAKLAGKSNEEALDAADYSFYREDNLERKTNRYQAAAGAARDILQRDRVRAAIAEALNAEDATPEFAVKQIVKTAAQSKHMPSKLKASETILRLHGYRETEKPTVKIEFGGSFFNQARRNPNEVVEAEVVDNE